MPGWPAASENRSGSAVQSEEDEVEDPPPYGNEDPWEDDWDWEGPEEPQVTCRDAIERLRSLIQGRTDVRIDWNGQRGLPRDDARIVFTATAWAEELRVRFRSATQLDEFTRIISSAALLADRRAIWYPSEQVITARLVGGSAPAASGEPAIDIPGIVGSERLAVPTATRQRSHSVEAGGSFARS